MSDEQAYLESGAATNTERLLLRAEIDEFNAQYANVLDTGDLQRWPDLFAEKPLYQLISRENYDSGLPIGPIYCDSRGMLEDRVISIASSMVYSPRTILHLITNVQLQYTKRDQPVDAQSNFLLVENMLDLNPRLLMAGRYIDKFVRENGVLRLQVRRCVYDTLMIQTSVVFPV